MSKLLSDKWDNAYLNETFHEALLSNRRQSNDPEQNEKALFFRETAVFLVDHPKLETFNTDVLVVEKDNKKMIFILKDALVNELNEQPLPTVEHITQKIVEYIEKTGMDVVNNVNSTKISAQEFSTFLKDNGMENIADILQLDKDNARNRLKM